MGDTIILSDTGNLSDQLKMLPPAVRDSVALIIQQAEHPEPDTSTQLLKAFLFLGVIAIVIYRSYRNKKADTSAKQTTQAKGYFYDGKDMLLTDADIAQILVQYFAYYTRLNEGLQLQFIQRLRQFMQTKIFHLPKQEIYKEVPVLLSAAAAQLTFGLSHSVLPWFRFINVTSREFLSDNERDPHLLAGNVEGHSINIAWNHFFEGITDCEDGCNVGLHELAHALYYEAVAVEKGGNRRFTAELRKVIRQIECIYKEGGYGQMLFSEYAFRNTQECWAESIELFFEKPAAMKVKFPDLYYHLTQLLQQDPCNQLNPLLS